MLRLAQKIRDLLFKDNLFLRVTIFITGALIGAIPLTAVFLGALSKNYNSALYILLVLFAIFAMFLLYASTFGSDRLVDKAAKWASSGDIIFMLGLVTFAIPVTLLIRLYQNKYNQY
jgi:hypothetical protein